jgi:hypothetical protein
MSTGVVLAAPAVSVTSTPGISPVKVLVADEIRSGPTVIWASLPTVSVVGASTFVSVNVDAAPVSVAVSETRNMPDPRLTFVAKTPALALLTAVTNSSRVPFAVSIANCLPSFVSVACGAATTSLPA